MVGNVSESIMYFGQCKRVCRATDVTHIGSLHSVFFTESNSIYTYTSINDYNVLKNF